MTRFSHLSRLDISEKTACIDVPELGEGAYLIGKPANQSNPRYFNALLKTQGAKKAAKSGGRVDMSVAKIKSSRQEDRPLVGRLVLTGWGNVKDEDGNQIEFTTADSVDLCAQLPDWLFDAIRQNLADPMTFVDANGDDADGEEVDLESVSGN